MNHINKLKNTNHTIILIDAENISDKIRHPFVVKTLKKCGHRGNIYQHNKGYR